MLISSLCKMSSVLKSTDAMDTNHHSEKNFRKWEPHSAGKKLRESTLRMIYPMYLEIYERMTTEKWRIRSDQQKWTLLQRFRLYAGYDTLKTTLQSTCDYQPMPTWFLDKMIPSTFWGNALFHKKKKKMII